jgi:hypothetical protein
MTDYNGFISFKMVYHGLDILHKVVHRVMLTTERFITQVVATQIKGDDLKERGERDHLIPPGIPEVWEAMDHDNQWPLPYTRIMDVYSIIFSIMMCHVLVDVIRKDISSCMCFLSHLLCMNDTGVLLLDAKSTNGCQWLCDARVGQLPYRSISENLILGYMSCRVFNSTSYWYGQ